jgi:hypothetical protein
MFQEAGKKPLCLFLKGVNNPEPENTFLIFPSTGYHFQFTACTCKLLIGNRLSCKAILDCPKYNAYEKGTPVKHQLEVHVYHDHYLFFFFGL